MTPIVEMRVGSHLYGTATAQSDLDLKGVYLPAASDILLQRVRPSISLNPGKAFGERNRPGDVDREFYSLQRYLDLLAGGQSIALDMLFAPESAWLQQPHACWLEIRANTDRLISRRAMAFVHYCRQQANKFGLKGARLGEARRILGLLEAAEARHGGLEKLAVLIDELEVAAHGAKHIGWIDLDSPAGPDGQTKPIRNLEVCGRKIPVTVTLKIAHDIVQRLVDDYGSRALAAERNEGVDWKALSHAVRVAQQAIELFRDHRIVFPLAGASHLRAIRAGTIAYDAVAEEIEQLVQAVEIAAAQSTLPETPDLDFIDDLATRFYRTAVVPAGEAS
ncbi:MAG TPA: nucleotidyltransferase domain-containing protein [Candidatus Nitrosotalea sp.]|jgi:hypothetical protein|nr:nucleotidyltransferase domain-containing protein [Candidatus Nitrosotalea sp.]